MKKITSGVKIILSVEEIETLIKAKDILSVLDDEIDDSKTNNTPCQVFTEDNLELDKSNVWDAYAGLSDLLYNVN